MGVNWLVHDWTGEPGLSEKRNITNEISTHHSSSQAAHRQSRSEGHLVCAYALMSMMPYPLPE